MLIRLKTMIYIYIPTGEEPYRCSVCGTSGSSFDHHHHHQRLTSVAPTSHNKREM